MNNIPLVEMKVVFVDWVPTNNKNDIRGGGLIRRYYAWVTLNKILDKATPFRTESGNINREAIRYMFDKNSKIWVEYGCGRVAHLFVLLASFIRSKEFVLNVHDFVVQQKDVDEVQPTVKKVQLQFFERVLLKRASTIIIPCPGLLDYFTPKKNQNVLIMVPGVGEDELFIHLPDKTDKRKKIALYFGSMRRKDAIPTIIDMFAELRDWELHLIGPNEGEKIIENENVKYLGSMGHDKLVDVLSNADADAIIIPYPKNDYLDKAMPIKLGYALKSCRPVIATKLRGVSEYIAMVGLEENVIYVEEWNLDSLKEALEKAQSLNINAEKTIKMLRHVAWEPRFEKAVEIALDTSQATWDSIEWI